MKRLFDVFFSVFLILILFPVIILIALTVRIKIGSPVLFVQSRPGLYSKPFKLIKFRTMLNAFDCQGNPLPDANRLCSFGRWLRSTSLDELPELLNVFLGNMSFVGPRPLLLEYLQFYNHFQNRRHELRPGITGWAQINGRNNLSWEEKFKLDVWYVDNRSFKLDVKILVLTLIKVFQKDGINAPGHATIEKFTGNHVLKED